MWTVQLTQHSTALASLHILHDLDRVLLLFVRIPKYVTSEGMSHVGRAAIDP